MILNVRNTGHLHKPTLTSKIQIQDWRQFLRVPKALKLLVTSLYSFTKYDVIYTRNELRVGRGLEKSLPMDVIAASHRGE